MQAEESHRPATCDRVRRDDGSVIASVAEILLWCCGVVRALLLGIVITISVKPAEGCVNKVEIGSYDESEKSVLWIFKMRVGIVGTRDSSRKALGTGQDGVMSAMRVEFREVAKEGKKRVVAGRLKGASDML